MMFSHSEGIANAILDGAILAKNSDKVKLTKQFAQLMDERLFNAGINLNNTQHTQNTINGIMKELNIVPNIDNANLLKATLQRIETSRAINKACGTTLDKTVDMKDITTGILKLFKAKPQET